MTTEARAEPETPWDVFVTRVRNDPSSTWLLDPDGRGLSYEQAAHLVAELAGRVREEVADVEADLVGLYLPNTWTWPIASLAAWSSRRSVACVGTQQPIAEAAARFRRAGARVIICEPNPDHATALEVAGFVPLAFEVRPPEAGDDLAVDELLAAAQVDPPAPHETAVLLFSSGTTGTPKSVRITHGNLLQEYGRDMAARRTPDGAFRPRTQPPSAAPGVTFNPFGHVAAFARLVFRMWTGEALIMVPKFSVRAVGDIAKRWPVDTLQLTPAMAHALANADADLDLPDLRSATCGTAALSERVRSAFETRFGVPLLQSYGSTEFGVLAHETAEDVLNGLRPANAVGRPAAGVTIRVVGRDGDDAAPGDVGEIVVSFEPARRERLPQFEGAARDGWYRTGDRGRLDEHGILSVDGRVDDLIIIGGFNVDPAVVEDAVRALPRVSDVAVAGVDDDRLGQVAGAVVVWDGRPPDPIDLDVELRRTLSPYKIPRHWVPADEIPLIGPGKVDRARVRTMLRAWAELA